MTTKEKPNETSRIIQLFLDNCKTRDYHPEKDNEFDFRYKIRIWGENGYLTSIVTFDAVKEYVFVQVILILNFLKSTLSELCKLTNEINNKYVSSKLVINTEENYVALEAIKRYAEIGAIKYLWKDIDLAVDILDFYIPAFHLVGYGTMGADKALETVERLSFADEMEEAMEELPN